MTSTSSGSAARQGLGWRARSRCFATLAVAAALSGPGVAAARTPTHVACVGDSITYGYGASSSSASYPSDLQKIFGSAVSVMNFGHSGATLLSVGDLPYQNQSEYTAATSFVSGAGASAAVAVVIVLGTNDAKPQNWMSGSSTRATQFQTDAGALVDHFAQLATHPTVYLGIPPRAYDNPFGIDGAVLQNQIDPILRAVATAKGIATIDLDAPTAGHAELFSDGVHPTDAGYMLVAMTVHDALVNGGAGSGGAGGGAGAAGGRGGGGGHSAGSGGASGGGHGGATGGLSGSGGMPTIGTGGLSGAGGTGTGGIIGSGGTGTGGTGTGGSATGGTGTGGAAAVGTGGAATGGIRAGSGGQSAMASGGTTSSASGGSGGATSPGTGGSPASGAANGSENGCACALEAGGPDGGLPWPAAASAICAWLAARLRRRRT